MKIVVLTILSIMLSLSVVLIFANIYITIQEFDDVLPLYGYNSSYFYKSYLATALPMYMIILFINIIAVISIMLVYNNKNKQRILELTENLSLANSGKEHILLITSSDMYSCLEDELQKTITSLRERREYAINEHEKLSLNLTAISHQLKTPLTGISLMVQLMRESDVYNMYLDKIERMTEHMEYMISSLLILSKIDAGVLEFKPEVITSAVLLDEAIEPLDEKIRLMNQQLIRYDQNISLNIDLRWTAQAVTNIIKNCIEHTPENGCITIECENNPLYSHICISDTGEGIFEEDLPHIFDRFFKCKNSHPESNGIGLSVTKAIIEMQNGIITAAQNPSGGTIFNIKFYKN